MAADIQTVCLARIGTFAIDNATLDLSERAFLHFGFSQPLRRRRAIRTEKSNQQIIAVCPMRIFFERRPYFYDLVFSWAGTLSVSPSSLSSLAMASDFAFLVASPCQEQEMQVSANRGITLISVPLAHEHAARYAPVEPDEKKGPKKMLGTAPPLPPVRVAVADPDESNIRARLWVLSTTFFSLLVTAWCCSLGPIAAIIALVVEKHVLVALLAAWIDITAPERA